MRSISSPNTFDKYLFLFCSNIDALAQHYTVYAFDLLGFGRSSRPPVKGKNAQKTERWWIDSMEAVSVFRIVPFLLSADFSQWANAMNLHDVIWAGHSLGAFLSASYAMKYPQRIRKLVRRIRTPAIECFSTL